LLSREQALAVLGTDLGKELGETDENKRDVHMPGREFGGLSGVV
jgi:hypothetical protein